MGLTLRTRRTAITVARLLLSAAMLWFLLAKISDSGSPDLPPLRGSHLAWLIGATLLTFVGIVLSAVRWQAVLNALGARVPLQRLLSHYLAGQFVANVLPTTIGGDVLRVSRLTRDVGESPTSFASVVLERLTGWVVLPMITFFGFLVNPPLRDLGRATQVALGLAAAVLGLLVLVVTLTLTRGWGKVEDQEGWRRFLAAVGLGLHRLREDPRRAGGVLLAGLAYQLTLVAAAVMAAHAIGIPAAGPTALAAFLPAVLIAQVLPISISGLGVREGLFVLFLRPLDVPSGQAITLGLLLYVLNLVVSLLGAPAFAVGGRSPGRAPS